MKPCPRCQSIQSWTLGDGRFKCRVCDARYSWKSVWDSVRLPEDAKEHLVEKFVQGVSVYRQRHDAGACVDSRERFYRLARAVCALQARVTRNSTCVAVSPTLRQGPRTCMRGWATTRAVMIIGISEENGAVRITPPSPAAALEILPTLSERAAIGGVYRVYENLAFASLQVQGDYVVIRRSSTPLAMSSIDAFWDYARERLQTFHKIHCKFVHLYLGEMCFRFNHQDTELTTLVRELLQSTSSSDVRAVLRDSFAQSGRHERRLRWTPARLPE